MRDLGRPKLSDVLFWILAGVSAVLLVALALILSGVIPVDPASQPEGAPDSVEQRPTTTSKSVTTAPVSTPVVLPDGTTSAANAAR